MKEINPVNDERVNKILEVVMAYAELDFSKKTKIYGNDTVDAIGAGINMLGEELEKSTVSLKEKEQLLKEIHHRVKNNLQIVSSLLNLQSENVLDEKYLLLIKESRNRINSMALVHEMLYKSKDLSKIELKDYINHLSYMLYSTFSVPESKIEFKFNIGASAFFEIDKMIPVGLILNEILSNAIKYAFPDRTGEIVIDFNVNEKQYILSVKDNGIGLPTSFNFKKDANLGMQLIYMLTEQLDGKAETLNGNGMGYRIAFPV